MQSAKSAIAAAAVCCCMENGEEEEKECDLDCNVTVQTPILKY